MMVSSLGLILFLVGLVICFLNYLHKYDPDRGKYKPSWKHKALYNKAYVHFVSGGLLNAILIFLFIPRIEVWIGIVILFFLWEISQGFFNYVDYLAGLCGAGIVELIAAI